MASYNELIALIDGHINKNGVQAITGQILNGVLKAIVEQVGRGYAIMGAATPGTDPGTPDAPESWFASTPGTYTNFGGLEVMDAEIAILSYTPATGTWEKTTLADGIREVSASVDGNVGTPEVSVEYNNGSLDFTFSNLKGNPGNDGAPAGFGTIAATVDGNIGTPAVSVETSGPATAKNMTFTFRNLKGETGVTSVVATVDDTSGTPSCAVSLVGQELHLDFSGLKGPQGNTGVSADYPIEIVNNLTTDDATKALSAAQGVVLDGKISQLQQEVGDGITIRTFTHSVFASETPNITLNNDELMMTQEGDFIEIKVNANGTRGYILRKPTSYNYPRIQYASANTLQVRLGISTQVLNVQNSSVNWNNTQVIKVLLVSVVDSEYTYDVFLDGAKVGSISASSVSLTQIGYSSIMTLYYIKKRIGGIESTITKFAEIEGAVGVTDSYTSQKYDGLVPLNERLLPIQEDVANLMASTFGEQMYYKYRQESTLWYCQHDFQILQRIKGDIYLCIYLVYFRPTNTSGFPKGYWRLERSNLVGFVNGEATVVQSQILTPGENEFVMRWLDGAGYNFQEGYTGGYHEGETIEDLSDAWVEFIIDGNRVNPTVDTPWTPCKSFKYREHSAIYQHNDDTIAAWHLKETEFKDGGYETINDVKFVQALDYFAYPGIVCVSRWLSEYAMPEGVATITDMGDGSTAIAEQFKSNGHRIHYEGNGYMCDVESEVLIGADDTQCQRVVYNSSTYNKFYRRNPDTAGSTSNRLKGRTKVKISAM